jgi:hypothetical protein
VEDSWSRKYFGEVIRGLCYSFQWRQHGVALGVDARGFRADVQLRSREGTLLHLSPASQHVFAGGDFPMYMGFRVVPPPPACLLAVFVSPAVQLGTRPPRALIKQLATDGWGAALRGCGSWLQLRCGCCKTSYVYRRGRLGKWQLTSIGRSGVPTSLALFLDAPTS